MPISDVDAAYAAAAAVVVRRPIILVVIRARRLTRSRARSV